MSRALLLAAPLALLAGCTGSSGPCNPEATPAFPPAPAGECAAAEFQRHVGAELTPALRAEITARQGDRRVRFIGPGDAVTQDFRPDRLNVTLDERNRIARLGCG